MRLQAQGMDLESWLGATGKQPQELLDDMREPAATGVKVDLALRAVADAEDLKCEDEDLEAEIDAVAQRVGEKPAKVLDRLERGGQLPGLRSDIRKRKALDWLVERVEVVDQEGQLVDRADLEVALDDTPDTSTSEDDTPDDDTESE